MKENVDKLHINCTDFNSSTRLTVYTECICVFCQNLVLVADNHCSDVCCDEFPMPQIDRKSKQINEHWHGKFYSQSVR